MSGPQEDLIDLSQCDGKVPDYEQAQIFAAVAERKAKTILQESKRDTKIIATLVNKIEDDELREEVVGVITWLLTLPNF